MNEEKNFALFPNAIIATCDIMNGIASDVAEFKSIISTQELSGAYLEIIDGDKDTYVLHIAKQNNSLIIIDGQHRIRGVERSNIDKNNFDFLLSFILEQDYHRNQGLGYAQSQGYICSFENFCRQ